MELKELIEKEELEWKERMHKEMGGLEVIINIAVWFMVFMGVVWAIVNSGPDNEETGILDGIIYMLWIATMYSISATYLYEVKENGKKKNIFEKYKNIPCDINELVKTKIIVFIRFILKPLLVQQIIILGLLIFKIDDVNFNVFNIWFWSPVIIFLYAVVITAVQLKIKEKSAMKHSVLNGKELKSKKKIVGVIFIVLIILVVFLAIDYFANFPNTYINSGALCSESVDGNKLRISLTDESYTDGCKLVIDGSCEGLYFDEEASTDDVWYFVAEQSGELCVPLVCVKEGEVVSRYEMSVEVSRHCLMLLKIDDVKIKSVD